MLFIALLLLHPAVGAEKAEREGQYFLKGMVATKIIKKCKLTSWESQNKAAFSRAELPLSPIKQLTQPHVRARGNSMAPNTTNCLRTHTRSQMLCLGITPPQVDIKIPELSF